MLRSCTDKTHDLLLIPFTLSQQSAEDELKIDVTAHTQGLQEPFHISLGGDRRNSQVLEQGDFRAIRIGWLLHSLFCGYAGDVLQQRHALSSLVWLEIGINLGYNCQDLL